MTLQEAIKQTGQVPHKFEFENGAKFELFSRKRINEPGYIVCFWQMVDGVQTHLFNYGEGITLTEAKDDLKRKLLKP